MGRRFKDLTGRTFGDLIVVGVDNHSKYRRWICKCKCGSVVSLEAGQLSKGHCGCLSKQDVPTIDKSKLYELYVTQRLSIQNISKATGLHRNTISKYISMYNLKQERLDHPKPIVRKQKKQTGPKPYKLIGRKFGRLTVLKYVEPRLVKCRCDCGKEVNVVTSNLYSGNTTSCGCLRIDSMKTHGESGSRLHYIWNSMIQRCENTNCKAYESYDGRGIRVCEEWHDASTFIQWAHNNGYKGGLTLDRKDNSGNYEPSNCRWATCVMQANNKRTNILIEIDGSTKTLMQWVREFGLDYPKTYRKYREGYRGKELFM